MQAVPRAKQRTPEMRERVLQAAVEMLATDGVAEFTTRRIAEQAHTSTPAVYELFGDKAGLVREVFFEGFRLLYERLEMVEGSGQPRAELVGILQTLRAFVRDNPVLAELMFSRPFADFDPGLAERQAGDAVRKLIVRSVHSCIDAGVLAGDETDIAHVLVALAQGLARQETAGWLGTSRASRDRRWDFAITAILMGLRPSS
jgi:AcrR family transcriptional regulator